MPWPVTYHTKGYLTWNNYDQSSVSYLCSPLYMGDEKLGGMPLPSSFASGRYLRTRGGESEAQNLRG